MGMRLVLCWVEGVAVSFEVCVNAKSRGEVGGDSCVEGVMTVDDCDNGFEWMEVCDVWR